MNVLQMNGFPEAVRIIERDLLTIFVEPVAFAVVIEDGAEHPAVAVEVSELRGLELLVKFRTAGLIEKFFLAPQAADGCAFRIAQ